MENYQKKLDRTLEALEGSRPGLLLHSCCGPCSSYVLEYLSRHFRLGLLYYDPNIQPEAEYELRLENQRRVLEHYPDIALHEYGWRGAEYEAAGARGRAGGRREMYGLLPAEAGGNGEARKGAGL